jgi:hypothetical protein
MNTKLKTLSSVFCTVFLLSACGGGGDDSIDTSNNTTPNSGPLAKYAGAYSFCDRNERLQISIEIKSPTEVSITPKSDYYASPNCQGAIVGTETYSAPVQATYISNSQANVTDWPTVGSNSVQNVDRVRFSVAARTTSVVGSNVTTSGTNRCVSYGNGGSTCVDTTPTVAANLIGGLSFTNTAILILTEIPGGYTREDAYPR